MHELWPLRDILGITIQCAQQAAMFTERILKLMAFQFRVRNPVLLEPKKTCGLFSTFGWALYITCHSDIPSRANSGFPTSKVTSARVFLTFEIKKVLSSPLQNN